MKAREFSYERIMPRELKERLERGEYLILLDVREPWELALSRLEGAKLVPMAGIPERMPELDRDAETVVICHHGLRSAYVTQFLNRSGFEKVLNLEGGLDAYSSVDPSVPRY